MKLVEAIPENITFGSLPSDKEPVLRIHSGDSFKMESVFSLDAFPEGIQPILDRHQLTGPYAEKLSRIDDAYSEIGREGIQITTGPVFVEEAAPGDMIEIQIDKIDIDLPFGAMFTVPGLGTVPDKVEFRCQEIRYKSASEAELFGRSIPLKPFFGIMGVGGNEAESALIPGDFGGNLDLKYLTEGATLHIPCIREGGFFYIGDPHAAQGNGEVSISAIETSFLSGTFTIRVDKEDNFRSLWAEDSYFVYILGLDRDLNLAMRKAVDNSCRFLMSRDPSLDYENALMLCSATVDFEVTQSVDVVLGVHGKIPRSLIHP